MYPSKHSLTRGARIAALATAWLAGAGAAAAAPGDPPQDLQELESVDDIQQISLESLLNEEVGIATVKPQTSRETAGIVTVVTREEIVNSGARDIIDLLRLVPGFTFGVDVQGTIDVGVRGNWGHEGKVLLLIDGQEMNELNYSTNALGNRFPVDQIERIEIIRGPGSAIYGGLAELAVINIITRGAELGGVAVQGVYGQMGDSFARRTVSLSFGQKFASGVSLAASGFVGQGNRSDGVYTDFEGNSYSTVDNAAMNPMFFNAALGFRDLRLRFIYDDFTFGGKDGYGTVLPTETDTKFRSYIGDARYQLKVGDRITVTPRLNFRYQNPWLYNDDADSAVFSDYSVYRLLANVLMSYDVTPQLNILAGVEGYYDHARLNDLRLGGSQALFGTENHVSYENGAGVFQALYNASLANFVVGARYEHHSEFGDSFVPRAAITKLIGRFHAKLLASQAFRAPGIENINFGPNLKPEKTTVFEAEVGYELTDHMFASLNAYDITIKRPIIYDVDPATREEIYQNFDRTGTRGIEAEYRLRYPRGYATASYSYYNARGKNKVVLYDVPTDDSLMLAFPAHKVAVSGNLSLWRTLSVNASAIALSERWGYLSSDDMGTPVLGKEGGRVLVNSYLLYRNLGMEGLDVGAGCFNMFDAYVPYLQPYNGGHAPLPGPSREVVGRLSYTLKFK
jgi:outer membrane receptor protein involved in Fe transport